MTGRIRLYSHRDYATDRLLSRCDVIEITSGADAHALSDLHMLLMHGGRERTEAEMTALLSRAELQVRGRIPAGGVKVLEVVRPR